MQYSTINSITEVKKETIEIYMSEDIHKAIHGDYGLEWVDQQFIQEIVNETKMSI